MRRWGIAVGLVLVLAAAGLGAAWWLGAFRGPQHVQMAVFLADDATPAQKTTIEGYLHSLHVVGEVHFETRQEAYEKFKKIFVDAPDITANVTPDVLPESFRFVLADAGDVAAVKARLQDEPGVQHVIAGPPVRSMGDIVRSP
jgi:cell division protein FtsX